jgi:hypothetical protein
MPDAADAIPDAMSAMVIYAAAARSLQPKDTKNLAYDASSLCCEFFNIAELTKPDRHVDVCVAAT